MSIQNLSIYMTYARPGNGKTIDMVRTALKLLDEYKQTERKYPNLPKRKLLSNLRFSEAIEARELVFDFKTGVPYPPYINPKTGKEETRHLVYWSHPEQLADVQDCDILIDEVQNVCPADKWSDLPEFVRDLFSQYRHRGIRFFVNTQDYKAVDINLRRMIGRAYLVVKVFSSRDLSATLPPPKRIYGIVKRLEFAPDQIEKEGVYSDDLEVIPNWKFWQNFFWISRKLVNSYNTRDLIPRYRFGKLKHYERVCEDCGKVVTEHQPF